MKYRTIETNVFDTMFTIIWSFGSVYSKVLLNEKFEFLKCALIDSVSLNDLKNNYYLIGLRDIELLRSIRIITHTNGTCNTIKPTLWRYRNLVKDTSTIIELGYNSYHFILGVCITRVLKHMDLKYIVYPNIIDSDLIKYCFVVSKDEIHIFIGNDAYNEAMRLL